MARSFFKIIGCEIAFREISHLAARSPSVLDLEWLTQGLHDRPRSGGREIQQQIDAVPAGKYDAILVGYGLCGNLILGLRARSTPLVIPRAHDCISLFLGSRRRHQERNETRPGTYYYSCGWLECLQRRGLEATPETAAFLPTPAGTTADRQALVGEWTRTHGADAAHYLLQTMEEWARHYTHGTWIDFEFARPLELDRQVRQICAIRGWEYESIPGDLGLLRRWIDGEWTEEEFLIVRPGEEVIATHDDSLITARPATDSDSDPGARPG